jgi:glycosyltransferase involved in cell wall biosynthesis
VARPLRAAFVYPNPRRIDEVAAGLEPDSQLHGMLYLHEFGVEPYLHDPLLSRRPLPGVLGRAAWSVRELTVPLEVGRPDVIFSPLGGLLPLAGRARPDVAVVVINFGLNLIYRRASPFRRRLLAASLRSADCVLCLGASQRAELVEWGVIPEEKAARLVIPVDDEFFDARPPQRADDGPPLVLAVGKDLARDYRTFAEAVRDLDVRVEVIAHSRNLEGFALPSNVTARNVSFDELRDLYARAACVVLPQRRDGYPYGSEGGGLTALMEGMAMGRPVVASERAILHDYVEHERDALLVPPEDAGALRGAIERVLADAELSERLGAAARDRILREHRSRDFAGRLADLFRLVVGRR